QRKQELFMVACTAPCQGMSKSGQGKLLNLIRQGKRPELDPRNRLILPALHIINRLYPLWVVFENVIEMRNTIIEDESGELSQILDVISHALGPEYVGAAYDVEFADYGVPQRRQRLITVYTRDPRARAYHSAGGMLIPVRTHAREPENGRRRWVSVTEALKGFPPLEASDEEHAVCLAIPFHRVPVLDRKKYEWIRHTPPGGSAFDNQCVDPACGYQWNAVHGTSRGDDGINRANQDTPLYCERCGALLPRPYTELPEGTKRIMWGYTSAYKRMAPDLPAPTLTRNLSYPCSDHKIHPYENRVLSLAEAMALQTIMDYEYRWGPITYRSAGRLVTKEIAPDTLIRLVIGESVPPRFLKMVGDHMLALSFGGEDPVEMARVERDRQMALF
ncbi:MAG: DNA cytosine methyltransferase, partial [Candidatus Methylomirabilales bacterium]